MSCVSDVSSSFSSVSASGRQLTVSTHSFSSGCSHFVDVDFSLITTAMRQSRNCQRLIWPVVLMRQLIRSIDWLSFWRREGFHWDKDMGATRHSFQQSVHHPASFCSVPRLTKLFPEVFQYGLHRTLGAVVIQGEIKLYLSHWLQRLDGDRT